MHVAFKCKLLTTIINSSRNIQCLRTLGLGPNSRSRSRSTSLFYCSKEKKDYNGNVNNGQILSLRPFQSSLTVTTRTMSTVYVKNLPQDDRLYINLDLSTADGRLKSFNLYRLKTEDHEIALERLRLNLTKKLSKKKKKKTKLTDTPGASAEASEEDAISLDIWADGKKVLPSVENEKAWVEGAFLRYGEENISIAFNLPSVKLDKFPSNILADFPLFPHAEFEFCDMEGCDFYWKVIPKNEVSSLNANISQGKLFDLDDTFHQDSCYTPNASDIGQHILLVCVPKSSEKKGKPDARLSEVCVESGPSTACPFEKRHEFTKEHSQPGEFRVVSYNLLADIYSSTDFAQDHLFPYCPKEFLNMNYRRHLLLKEIVGYKADLLCFQEVDKSIFATHLVPALQSLGFEGMIREKSGKASEGCATFVRKDKFRIINQLDIVLSEFLTQDPSCQDIWDKVKENEHLKDRIVQRSSILQVTVVESLETPNKYICLANTHLFFRPDACNIRLIHAATALRHLQNICNSYEQEGKTVAIVFCGDFNSPPHLGVYQLFTSQFVPTDHVDWLSGGKEEVMTNLELGHSLNIASACGCPEYTNFTAGFQSTLDYVFIDASKLKVSSVVPMPDHADVTANVALPSVVIPSDHIALVCDLQFAS